jgi:hypothetical protein
MPLVFTTSVQAWDKAARGRGAWMQSLHKRGNNGDKEGTACSRPISVSFTGFYYWLSPISLSEFYFCFWESPQVISLFAMIVSKAKPLMSMHFQ